MFSPRMFVAIIFLFSFALNSSLFCQTQVRGVVSGVWDINGSPYIAVDDIRIQARESLRIEPGVSVIFERGISFLVNGLLIAVGEEDNLINFSPVQDDVEWFGIDIINADDETSFMYCVIEGASAPEEWGDPGALGGGLYCSGTNIAVSRSTFRFNYANECGGGAYFTNCSPNVENNVFTNNSADRDAGAIFFNECEGFFTDNLVENNRAIRYSCGGVFLRRSATRIAFNKIFSNISGTQWGSGLYMDYNCSPEIERNLICQNSQGGIYMGVRCESASFLHNTIANNAGRTGILLYSQSTIRAINCIIYGNDSSIWLVSGSQMWLDYTDIENPEMDGVTIGNGVFDEDPMFIDEEHGDFGLRINSPCIDAGDPESPRDLDDSIADIGAICLELVDGETDMVIEPDFLNVEEPGEYVINITNEGDNRLLWHSLCNVDWVTCDPERMLMDPAEDVDVIVEITDEGLGEGIHRTDIQIFSNDRNNPEIRIPVQFTIPAAYNLIIPLNSGWNQVSLNIEPSQELWRRREGPDIELLFAALRIDHDHHHVSLAKDEDGQFWLPRYNFNHILYLDLEECWEVCVDEDVEIEWEGLAVPPDADLLLKANWNFVAYYPTYQLDASEPDYYVLSPIIDNVLMAKDCAGNFMAPQQGFSNLPPWQEGCGYKIKVDRDIVLNYPPPDDERLAGFQPPANQIMHWTTPRSTGNDMSLLLKTSGLSSACEVGAFTSSGILIGAAKPNEKGLCGMAIWGDDISTEGFEGILDGEKPLLRLWDGFAEYAVEVKTLEGSLSFSSDEFTYGELIWDQSKIVRDFSLSAPHPNPFNNRTQVSFTIPESGIFTLGLFDLNGRLMAEIHNGFITAGSHQMDVDSGNLTSGVYLLKSEFGNEQLCRKVVLIR